MRELVKVGTNGYPTEVFLYLTQQGAVRYGVRCNGVVVSDGWQAANRAERVATAVRVAVWMHEEVRKCV